MIYIIDVCSSDNIIINLHPTFSGIAVLKIQTPLQIPHRINLIPHIIFHIDPKGEDHVNDDRRGKGEKCDIHEEEAHTTGGNAHFIP